MSGNGMPLPALAAWIVYCWSRAARAEPARLLEEHSLTASLKRPGTIAGSEGEPCKELSEKVAQPGDL